MLPTTATSAPMSTTLCSAIRGLSRFFVFQSLATTVALDEQIGPCFVLNHPRDHNNMPSHASHTGAQRGETTYFAQAARAGPSNRGTGRMLIMFTILFWLPATSVTVGQTRALCGFIYRAAS